MTIINDMKLSNVCVTQIMNTPHNGNETEGFKNTNSTLCIMLFSIFIIIIAVKASVCQQKKSLLGNDNFSHTVHEPTAR